jgi:cobaltochelatase CobN
MLGKPSGRPPPPHAGAKEGSLDEAAGRRLRRSWSTRRPTACWRAPRRRRARRALPAALREQLEAGAPLVRRPRRRQRATRPAVGAGRALHAHLLRRRPDQEPRRLPTGRNLYGFDPSRVPTKARPGRPARSRRSSCSPRTALKTGGAEEAHLSLWSVETMRHFGLLEAQACGRWVSSRCGMPAAGHRRQAGAARASSAGRAWTWCCRPPACTATTSPTS